MYRWAPCKSRFHHAIYSATGLDFYGTIKVHLPLHNQNRNIEKDNPTVGGGKGSEEGA